jgi:hypothetical protein
MMYYTYKWKYTCNYIEIGMYKEVMKALMIVHDIDIRLRRAKL